METTRCLLLSRRAGEISRSVERVSLASIPNEGDAVVRVLYSAVNYKDALAVTGRGKIVRADYPFVPGIDLVGRVVESEMPALQDGDLVVATGHGLGENEWGGYSEFQRVRSDRLIKLPVSTSPELAATAGTAGLTAMLSAFAIEQAGIDSDRGDVVVTGATGGVGSFAVLFLSRLGYRVVASTGKPEAEKYLGELGATEVVHRSVLEGGPRRPLDTGRWAAAVDSVGGKTLSAILSGVKWHGVVASCGLVGGAELETTLYPFILRGVSLVGIDSNTCPMETRREAWGRMRDLLSTDDVARIATTIELEDVGSVCEEVLAGRVCGRLIVRVAGDN